MLEAVTGDQIGAVIHAEVQSLWPPVLLTVCSFSSSRELHSTRHLPSHAAVEWFHSAFQMPFEQWSCCHQPQHSMLFELTCLAHHAGRLLNNTRRTYRSAWQWQVKTSSLSGPVGSTTSPDAAPLVGTCLGLTQRLWGTNSMQTGPSSSSINQTATTHQAGTTSASNRRMQFNTCTHCTATPHKGCSALTSQLRLHQKAGSRHGNAPARPSMHHTAMPSGEAAMQRQAYRHVLQGKQVAAINEAQ